MIELIIVYCLATDAKTCTEKHLPLDRFDSLVGCTMSGQMRAQEFLQEHPSFVMKSWRCEANLPKQASNDAAAQQEFLDRIEKS